MGRSPLFDHPVRGLGVVSVEHALGLRRAPPSLVFRRDFREGVGSSLSHVEDAVFNLGSLHSYFQPSTGGHGFSSCGHRAIYGGEESSHDSLGENRQISKQVQ